jgi:hypothetical protein
MTFERQIWYFPAGSECMEEIIHVASVKAFGHELTDVRSFVCCSEISE